MNEEIAGKVMGLRGVQGTALMGAMGDVVESTIEEGQVLEFMGFLGGMVPSFEQVASLGRVKEVILKGPSDDLITMYLENDQALGVIADNRTSVRILKQQIHDMLQWD